MTEHIYKDSDMEHERYHVIPFGSMREEIVRCRDCFYYKVKNGQEGCWYFRHSEQTSYYSWHYVPEYVELDGFCAWGERREP